MSGLTCVVPPRRGAPRFGKKQVRWERFRRNCGASVRRIIGTATPYPAVNLHLILILSIGLISGSPSEQDSPGAVRTIFATESNFFGICQVRTPGCRYTLSEASQGDTGLGAGPGDNRFKWSLSIARHHRNLKTGRQPESGRRPVFFLMTSLQEF